MYSSYSTLQRKQLTKQVYTDTQSTYLLVYAPVSYTHLVAVGDGYFSIMASMS